MIDAFEVDRARTTEAGVKSLCIPLQGVLLGCLANKIANIIGCLCSKPC